MAPVFELPEGEHIVSMIQHKGVVYVASNKRIFVIGSDDKARPIELIETFNEEGSKVWDAKPNPQAGDKDRSIPTSSMRLKKPIPG
jgi:hypothetical protein